MKFTRKIRKMGNLIKSLFFRETGEHVRNMFFLCPQLTEDQGEFSKDEGDFTGVERRGGDPKIGTRPHLMRWRILKGWRTSQSPTRPHTPPSTPLILTSLTLHYPSTSLHSTHLHIPPLISPQLLRISP
jgi:hypothetical protein